MRFALGKPVTTGIYTVDNAGTAAVMIQSVTLPGAHGLRMTKAWLVPIGQTGHGGTLIVGAGWPYPPSSTPLIRSVWAKRRPAAGATIRPGQSLNLVFGLIRTTAPDGTSEGPAIQYSAGGSTYAVQEQTSLVVSASCFNPTLTSPP